MVIIASTYGNGSNTQNVRNIRGNLTIVDNVDARRLERGSYTATRRFDDIIFNAPRAESGFRPETRILINQVLQSALFVLEVGGAMRFSSTDGMPGGDRLNILVNARPPGYINAFKRRYEVDTRFGVPYTIRRNDGTPLYPPGKKQPQVYWFSFQKG